MDLAADYAVQLPMLVIAEMLGIPVSDRSQFKGWNDVMVKMSYTVTVGRSGGEEAVGVMNEFIAATAEMNDYLTDLRGHRVVTSSIPPPSRIPTCAAFSLPCHAFARSGFVISTA